MKKKYYWIVGIIFIIGIVSVVTFNYYFISDTLFKTCSEPSSREICEYKLVKGVTIPLDEQEACVIARQLCNLNNCTRIDKPPCSMMGPCPTVWVVNDYSRLANIVEDTKLVECISID